jgi:tetratricopeptide (TPR) repeat protein
MQRLGYIQGEGTALWVLGTSLAQGDQREQAVILLKEAISLLTRSGDRIMAARAYQSIGISYGMLSQRENFSDSFSKARFMFSELDMPEAEVDCLYNLASAEVNVLDPKSIDHFREARGLYLTQKRSREAARCLKGEALMRMLCKNTPHEQLLGMHKQARKELLATGDKVNATWAMVNIGSQLQESKDIDGAQASFEVALKEFEEDDNARAADYVRGMLHLAISQSRSSSFSSV